MSDNVEDDAFLKWRNIPTSIIAAAAKGEAHLPHAIRPIRPLGQQPYLFGRAVTVRCLPPGLNAAIEGIAKLRRGSVLVLAADGNNMAAMCGDLFAGAARRAGCSGVVCDGAIRDTREMAKWDDFSVFARTTTPFGGIIKEGGAVNVARIGARTVMPGDLVVGDDDGVVVLGRDDAERLLRRLGQDRERPTRATAGGRNRSQALYIHRIKMDRECGITRPGKRGLALQGRPGKRKPSCRVAIALSTSGLAGM